MSLGLGAGSVILPGVSSGDLSGVHMLLSMIGDPDRAKEAKETIEQMAGHAKNAQDRLAAATAAEKRANEVATANQAKMAELDAREKAVVAREQKAAATQAEYEKRLVTMRQWMREQGLS